MKVQEQNTQTQSQIHKNGKKNKPCLTMKVQGHLWRGDLPDRLCTNQDLREEAQHDVQSQGLPSGFLSSFLH